MNATTDDVVEFKDSLHRKWWLNLLIVLGALLALLYLVLPTAFDRSGSRRAMREAGALATLRKLTRLQTSYAVSHPAQRFACELQQLKPVESEKGDYLPNEEFATGTSIGYRFTLVDCERDATGTARRYQFSAAPIDPGNSAIRAFCVDQTSVFWYDPSGSAKKCLEKRQPLL
jgi:hypothetical protein